MKCFTAAIALMMVGGPVLSLPAKPTLLEDVYPGFTVPDLPPNPGNPGSDQHNAWVRIKNARSRATSIGLFITGVPAPPFYLGGYINVWLDAPINGVDSRWQIFKDSKFPAEANQWVDDRNDFVNDHAEAMQAAMEDLDEALELYYDDYYFNATVRAGNSESDMDSAQNIWIIWDNLLIGDPDWLWGFCPGFHP